MELTCDTSLAEAYSSGSQRARIITESWVASHGYCLACDSNTLRPTPKNTKARDFECPECGHPYELKSTRGDFGRQINDGAYSAMLGRINSSTTSSFLLLAYSESWTVCNFQAIHHLFITPAAIVARNPLSKTAVRAGWVGCNILLSQIPIEGRIDIVRNDVVVPREECRHRFRKNEELANLSISQRSWTADILNLIHRIAKQQFTLEDVYSFEGELAGRFPNNRNVRPKIRQQLQVLRDLGFIEFHSRGIYRIVQAPTRSDKNGA